MGIGSFATSLGFSLNLWDLPYSIEEIRDENVQGFVLCGFGSGGMYK